MDNRFIQFDNSSSLESLVNKLKWSLQQNILRYTWRRVIRQSSNPQFGHLTLWQAASIPKRFFTDFSTLVPISGLQVAEFFFAVPIRTDGNFNPHRRELPLSPQKKNIRCKQSPFAFYTFPFLWLEIRSDLQPICGLFQLLLEFRNSEFNPTNAIKSLRFRAIRNKNLVVDISINCGNLNN